MRKPRVHIIISSYYLFGEKRIVYGGIQTYFNNLMPLFQGRGYECWVYQSGDENGEVTLPTCHLKGYDVSKIKNPQKQSEFILKDIMDSFDDSTDILLFSSDVMNCKNAVTRSITIQHGIYWDMPEHIDYSPQTNALYSFRKVFNTYNILKRNNYAKTIICVDYNFPNWYKAVSAYQARPITVIPNFTTIAPVADKPEDIIRIIFARRLRKYRGANVFADAMAILLPKYPNVELTIAGIGPEESYMRAKLAGFENRVVFTQYEAKDSLKVHKDKHIAVVPTVGSEGTSLSLLEAMSAQCAVVCTSVGGLSNIVIDEFNGLVVTPDANSIAEAIERLIIDDAYRKALANRGYETVKQGFSYEKWAKKWLRVIDNLIH